MEQMKRIFAFINLLAISFLFSQNSLKPKSYEISICGNPQTVFLAEHENEVFIGYIETVVTKVDEFSRQNIEEKIINKNYLSSQTVKELITELQAGGIDSLTDCNEDENCRNNLFLDGDSVYFVISDQHSNKNLSYQSIYPESQCLEHEKMELRRKVQVLLTIIDKKLNLKNQFQSFIKSLGEAKYCYWSGTTQCCIDKQK
jgi:hypothetical protein